MMAPVAEMAAVTIDSLANEVLSLVFEFYHSTLPSGTPPIVVSHVCARWRSVVLDLAPAWSTLTITDVRCPDVLHDFLSRAKHRLLSLSLILEFTGIELWPGPRLADFRDTFRSVRSFIPRISSLALYAPNPTLRIVINNVFKGISLPALASLTVVLRALKDEPLCVFGPLDFDPAVFTHLALNRVMIEAPAPSLAALRSLSLTHSSGSFLNHELLIHPRYPTLIPAPAMPLLTELNIDATRLLQSDHESPNKPFKASFGTKHLETLRLANLDLRMGRIHYPNAAQLLFRLTWGPNIRCLTLEKISEQAMVCFLNLVVNPRQPEAMAQDGIPGLMYASVTKLTINDVAARVFCNDCFTMAFPDLNELSVSGVDMTRVWFYLNPTQQGVGTPWPKVTEVTVDGVVYNRFGPASATASRNGQ